MKRMLVLAGIAALAMSVTAGSAYGQGGKDAKPMAPPPMDSMMAQVAKFAAPGPQHKILEKLAGKWTVTTKMWMDPSAPPMVTSGSLEASMLLGGRWLKEDYKGEMMGMPFAGLGMVGYDNFRQNYVSTWIDNMGCGLMTATGSANAEGTELNLSGTVDDPVTGTKDMKYRDVIRWTGPDQFVFEMYATMPGKGEMKMMEIAHVRAK